MPMNVLPKGVKRRLHGLFSHFLWGGSVDKRKLHLVSWDVVTSPMWQGGLRIMDLGEIGKAFTSKWILNYANNKDMDSLWRESGLY